jgi:hypothetical protein
MSALRQRKDDITIIEPLEGFSFDECSAEVPVVFSESRPGLQRRMGNKPDGNPLDPVHLLACLNQRARDTAELEREGKWDATPFKFFNAMTSEEHVPMEGTTPVRIRNNVIFKINIDLTHPLTAPGSAGDI